MPMKIHVRAAQGSEATKVPVKATNPELTKTARVEIISRIEYL
jgi:hypothetical protein